MQTNPLTPTQNNQALIDAIIMNDIQKLEALLKYAPVNLVNSTDHRGASLLWIAAELGYKEMFEMLLKKNADVNLQNGVLCGGFSPLGIATYYRHADIVKMLLDHKDIEGKKDIKVDLPSSFDKVTPLWIAAYLGDFGIAKMLVDHDANVNSANKNGIPPICVAVREGHYEIVKLLYHAGADYNLKHNGLTPLEVARMELSRKAHDEYKFPDLTPLEFARMDEARKKKYADIVDFLTNPPPRETQVNSTLQQPACLFANKPPVASQTCGEPSITCRPTN